MKLFFFLFLITFNTNIHGACNKKRTFRKFIVTLLSASSKSIEAFSPPRTRATSNLLKFSVNRDFDRPELEFIGGVSEFIETLEEYETLPNYLKCFEIDMLQTLLALECRKTLESIKKTNLDESKLELFVGLITCESFLISNTGSNNNLSQNLLDLERNKVERLILNFLIKNKKIPECDELIDF